MGLLIALVANVRMRLGPVDHSTCAAHVRIRAYEFEGEGGPRS